MFAKPLSTAPLKLGFLSPHNPYDRVAFSGTTWFAARALEQHTGIDLRILGPHTPPRRFDRFLRRQLAPVDVSQLDLNGLDAVLGLVASPLLAELAKTDPKVPLFHITDATPVFLRDTYGWSIPKTADETETQVATRASATIYSSDAIARRAATDLGLPGLQPVVVPFGVNMDDLLEDCPSKPQLDRLKLLFIGLDWARKGGDIAVATLDQLNADGCPAELTIVGRCPERHRHHPAIVNAGFLNKTKAKNRTRLSALYRDAHLLLLPSRGDCTPMVIAEAMAHGTPVLATDTGGVAEQIGRGGAGRVLPPMASPQEWATAACNMTRDRDGYELMSDAAFDRSRTLFSWDQWASSIYSLIQGELAETPAQLRKIA